MKEQTNGAGIRLALNAQAQELELAARVTETPLDDEMTFDLIRDFEGLYGFPSTERSLANLAKSVREICGTEEQLRWLIDHVRRGATRMPAPIEMRRAFCQKFRPADGLEDREVDMSDMMGGGRKGEAA